MVPPLCPLCAAWALKVAANISDAKLNTIVKTIFTPLSSLLVQCPRATHTPPPTASLPPAHILAALSVRLSHAPCG